ncbi:MAG: hypothetical protein E7293_02315 [Lachnospiraceae bacterium]|nr:hypothetical protein [Lachnospiraceae bacterium]
MKKIFKRMHAFLLAVTVLFSLVACGREDVENPDNSGSSVSDGSGQGQQESFTYNTALADFPTNWSPFQNQTATDAEILNYITEGFYVFDYNETEDGYRLVPGAAAAEPEDVTADYVGRFGIEKGETARAWKITLRKDLMWEDGVSITAQDYVKSAQLLLAPKAQNHRADSLYSGNLSIVNAQEYLYQGQYAFTDIVSANPEPEEYIAMSRITVSEEGTLTVQGKDIALNIYSCGRWDEDRGMDAYYKANKELFVKDGKDLYTELFTPLADAKGYVRLTEEILEGLKHVIAGLKGYEDVEEYEKKEGSYGLVEWQEFCFLGQNYPEISFDQVGVTALSDTELVLILKKPLDGFYLLYALTDSWLVDQDLYLSCASEVNGVYTNSYGTSAETTISYGPYTLEFFQPDKQYVLKRNENFHGVKEGYYETTTWQVDCVSEPSTRLEMFLNGQLDTYELAAEDMETYATSDHTYYTTSDSTFFVALNPDMDALVAAQKALGNNYNKTILTVKEFRQALSFALDRSAFALAALPTCNPAFGVYSNLIVSDPETGETYRSTESAKWVLARFWGVSDDIGTGKMYETVDDAVANITGYNLEMARQLFQEAYEIAIADELMDENDVVEIKIGLPNSTSQAYAKGYEFLVNCYTEAVKGTPLEGRLSFSKDDTLGNGFANALRSNRVDMLFLVGWTGSALDPYSLMEAYTTSDYQYNPSWDTSKEMVTINIDGTDYTASVLDWTYCMGGEEIVITAKGGGARTFRAGVNDHVDEIRLQILTALENAVLSTYDLIPLVDDSTAALKGMQVQYYTEEYIFGVGRGGLKYMTYQYSDEEWEEFVAQKGGSLIYR